MLLAVDCCFHVCSVGIYDPHTSSVLGLCSRDTGGGHSEHIMGVIEECLSEAGVQYADLSLLAVTNGPGSFTGVRVGLAMIKGIALGLGIPVVTVSTLEVAAYHAVITNVIDYSNIKIITLIDACREQVYLQSFKVFPNTKMLISSNIALAVGYEDICIKLDNKTVLCGSGALRLKEYLLKNNSPVIQSPVIHDLSAVPVTTIIKFALHKPVNKFVRPLYLRSPDVKPRHMLDLKRI